MALAADEESGAVDADAMVEEEEQRSSASLSSSSDESSNNNKYNGVYTKEDFPGADAFASWLGRAGVDPEKDLFVVFLTQLIPSSTYPIRRELRARVYQALVG